MKQLFVLALIGITLFSCNDDSEEVNNQNGNIIFSVTTTSGSSTTVTGRQDNANNLEFTSGTITIREVVFDGDNGAESVSQTIEQVADIDYATGDVSPEVVVEVPAGEYTNVYLGIEMQDDGDTPSTVINGTYTNSSEEVIEVRFEFNSGEVFEAEAAQVTIQPGADIVGKITFDALDWFSTITIEELDNATLTDGVMVISSTSNPDIFDIVADRLDVATEAVFE